MRGQQFISRVLGMAAVAVLCAAGTASATSYPDTTNDAFEGGPNPHLEITSVDVTNDATNLTFTVNLAGDPTNPNWGKYLIGIDTVAGGITNSDGWGKPITMSSGMDYFVGSWMDSGTGWELYHDNGAGGWNRDHASYDAADPLAPIAATSSSVSYTLPLSYLNLGDGSTFKFDVWTSGGGGSDSANDASANPSQSITGWNEPYDSGTNLSTFTVVVPEPGSMAIFGIAGLSALRRRARR
jgi:hypothetical protein